MNPDAPACYRLAQRGHRVVEVFTSGQFAKAGFTGGIVPQLHAAVRAYRKTGRIDPWALVAISRRLYPELVDMRQGGRVFRQAGHRAMVLAGLDRMREFGGDVFWVRGDDDRHRRGRGAVDAPRKVGTRGNERNA